MPFCLNTRIVPSVRATFSQVRQQCTPPYNPPPAFLTGQQFPRLDAAIHRLFVRPHFGSHLRHQKKPIRFVIAHAHFFSVPPSPWAGPTSPASAAPKTFAICSINAFAFTSCLTRWLIEFIGVSEDSHGKLKFLRKQHKYDWRITDLGGEPFPLDSENAKFLGRIWKGCSQATSHPTHNANHPPINIPQLEKALRIIFDHLENSLYGPAKIDMGI
jgi:hypothetical protein